MKGKKTTADCVPGFYRHSEGVNEERYKPLDRSNGVSDDLMVGLYSQGGGCKFEFQVELRDLGSNGETIRVCVFSDAFAVFSGLGPFKGFFQWLSKEKPTTLDQVQAWLAEFGFVNMLSEVKGGR